MTDILEKLIEPIEFESEPVSSIKKFLQDFDHCFCPDEFRPHPFYSEDLRATADYSNIDIECYVPDPKILNYNDKKLLKIIIKQLKLISTKPKIKSIAKLLTSEYIGDDATYHYYDELYSCIDICIVRCLKKNSYDELIFIIKKFIDLSSDCDKLTFPYECKHNIVRLIFYMSYYFIVLFIKQNKDHIPFINVMIDKLSEIKNVENTKFFTSTEIETYDNFLMTMKIMYTKN